MANCDVTKGRPEEIWSLRKLCMVEGCSNELEVDFSVTLTFFYLLTRGSRFYCVFT
jgi:hypothetical protein